MDASMQASTDPGAQKPTGKAIGYMRRWSDQKPDATLAEALRAEGCERVFEDVLEDPDSALTALNAAIQASEDGDVLIVPSLEHVARSLRLLDERIAQLADLGVTLRAIKEDILVRPHDPCSFRASVSMLRDFEYSIVSDRIRRSLVKAAANGRRGGRQRALTDDKLLEVKRLLKEPDLTVAEIAATVGVSAATIYRHIPSPRGQRPQS